MSSSASPALQLDLQADAVIVGALVTWAGLILAALWQAELPPGVLAAGSLLVAGWATAGIRTQLFGAHACAPSGLIWDDEGHWFLCFPGGERLAATLLPGSRMLPPVILLRLRSSRGRHWLLLRDRAGETATMLRRFRVRLVLERSRQPAAMLRILRRASRIPARRSPGVASGPAAAPIRRAPHTHTTIRRL
jgi:hypothetical protein